MLARPRRNRRPRDELGRPLPYRAHGFTPPSWTEPATPAEAIELAQRLLDDGLPFYAHEVLEDAWKAAPASERELWRGLAQLAVGLTHRARGNQAGASTLVRRGAAALEAYRANPPHNLDIDGLLAWAGDFGGSKADDNAGASVPQLLVR